MPITLTRWGLTVGWEQLPGTVVRDVIDDTDQPLLGVVQEVLTTGPAQIKRVLVKWGECTIALAENANHLTPVSADVTFSQGGLK